jgi:hypothetical protein
MRPAGVDAAPKEGKGFLSCKVGGTYGKPKKYKVFRAGSELFILHRFPFLQIFRY